MAADRIAKYLDDSKDLLLGGNQAKIVSEVKKLSSYLLKHQNETVPDGAKTKLLSTIDAYYRYCSVPSTSESTREEVANLLGTYLQLPEGKLVSATNKKKALNWIQELTSVKEDGGSKSVTSAVKYTSWIVTGITDSGELTLLNEGNSELWREDYRPANIASFMDVLRNLSAESDSVIVKINESDNTIVEMLPS